MQLRGGPPLRCAPVGMTALIPLIAQRARDEWGTRREFGGRKGWRVVGTWNSSGSFDSSLRSSLRMTIFTTQPQVLRLRSSHRTRAAPLRMTGSMVGRGITYKRLDLLASYSSMLSYGPIICDPQSLARSLKSGFELRIRLSFFSRRQPLSCFSRAMAVRMSTNCS